MKLKKLLAVALSAVMAVSVLSACGGGIFEKTTLDMGEVATLLGDTEATVNSSEGMRADLEAVKKAVTESGTLDGIEGLVETQRNWGYDSGSISWVPGSISGSGTTGWVYCFQDGMAEDKNEFMVGVWPLKRLADGVEKLGDLDTPEKVAAAGVFKGLEVIPSKLVSTTYDVGAIKVTVDNTDYWIVVVEANIVASIG